MSAPGTPPVRDGARTPVPHQDRETPRTSTVEQLERFFETSLRQARRAIALLVGSTVVAIGAIMLVLPGPGLLVIALGLGVLAIEFAWARRWLAEIRRRADGVRRQLRGEET